MSGGSMNYLYSKILHCADFPLDTPERIAFAAHLKLVAQALHDIEWVDSGDYGPGDENAAIRACLSERPAEPAQEPVAWGCNRYIENDNGFQIGTDDPELAWGRFAPDDNGWWPLYIAPPQRTMVPLQGGGGHQMIDATKLQCLTTANWLKGYASSLDAVLHSALIHRLNQASQLLQQVWNEYERAQGETHDTR